MPQEQPLAFAVVQEEPPCFCARARKDRDGGALLLFKSPGKGTIQDMLSPVPIFTLDAPPKWLGWVGFLGILLLDQTLQSIIFSALSVVADLQTFVLKFLILSNSSCCLSLATLFICHCWPLGIGMAWERMGLMSRLDTSCHPRNAFQSEHGLQRGTVFIQPGRQTHYFYYLLILFIL